MVKHQILIKLSKYKVIRRKYKYYLLDVVNVDMPTTKIYCFSNHLCFDYCFTVTQRLLTVILQTLGHTLLATRGLLLITSGRSYMVLVDHKYYKSSNAKCTNLHTINIRL